ncbi:MAG: hypothetical protein IT183_07480 [Acidobacteria bacterium]|nr:hypothetical protein [Acidobacteriota bacterium]
MSEEQHRLYSGITAAAAAVLMVVADGWASGAALLAGCALALALIWFAGPLADFVGRVGFRHIARPSPPGLVRVFGWAFLAVFLGAAALGAARALGLVAGQ